MIKNFKKQGVKIKTNRIKSIKFVDEFKQGMRLGLCLKCGTVLLFMGLIDLTCELCKGEIKIYPYNQFEDCILAQQEILAKNYIELKQLKKKIICVETDLAELSHITRKHEKN